MGEIVEIDDKGRIVIPKNVRDQLGFVDGSKLVIESDGKKIILRGLELKEVDEEESVKKNDDAINGNHLRQFLSRN